MNHAVSAGRALFTVWNAKVNGAIDHAVSAGYAPIAQFFGDLRIMGAF